MGFEVELRNVEGRTTALGTAGPPLEIEGRAAEQELRSLVDHVDAIAEIPNSLRGGTEVRLTGAIVAGQP
jgi:hypothetical protein